MIESMSLRFSFGVLGRLLFLFFAFANSFTESGDALAEFTANAGNAADAENQQNNRQDK